MKVVQNGLANAFRFTGQALDSLGKRFECHPYTEKLQPSLAGIKLGKSVPELKNVTFIAPSSTIIGKVAIASNSSVWYGAVIRGDVNTIKIGESVTIGDRCMIHCAGIRNNFPTVIGDNVVLGAGSILHGCTVENDTLIGDGAQVMDGAKVAQKSILLAGSLLPPGKELPSGQVWGGIPAQYIRDITDEDLASIQALVQENFALGAQHQKECSKTWQTIEEEEYDHDQIESRSSYYYRRLTPEEMGEQDGEFEGHTVPGRVFDSNGRVSVPRYTSRELPKGSIQVFYWGSRKIQVHLRKKIPLILSYLQVRKVSIHIERLSALQPRKC